MTDLNEYEEKLDAIEAELDKIINDLEVRKRALEYEKKIQED